MIIWFLIWGHLVFGNFSLSPPIKAFSTYWSEIGWSQTFKMGKIFNMGKMFKKFKPLDLSQSPNRWPHFFPSPRIECEGWITLQENQTNKILSILPFFLSEKRHWLFLRTFWPTLEQNQTPPVRKKFKRLKRTSTPESVVSYEYVAETLQEQTFKPDRSWRWFANYFYTWKTSFCNLFCHILKGFNVGTQCNISLNMNSRFTLYWV